LVINPTKYFSIFGNKATNYQGLAPSTRDVNNNYLSFSTGRGTDVGVKFFLSAIGSPARLTIFNTEQDNISVGMNNYNEIKLNQ